MADDLRGLIGCFAVGGGLLYNAIKNHRQARSVEDTQRSKVFSAPQGFVEFEGFAWPVSEPVNTGENIDGFQIVYYSFKLEKAQSQGGGRNRTTEWITVYSRVDSDPFFLVDPTGLAMVSVESAELNLEGGRTRNWRAINQEEQNHIVEKVMEDRLADFPPSNFLFGIFGSRYRIVETEILVGSPIYVRGDYKGIAGEPENVSLPGLTQFFNQVCDSKTRNFKSKGLMFDKNGDGKITSHEAKIGYATIAKIASQKAKTEALKEEEFSAYGVIGSSEAHKLLVADTHEKYLVSRLNRFIWLKFIGGAALIALGCVWLVSPNFKLSHAREFSQNTIPLQRNVAQAEENINLKHQACVDGSVTACETLLSRRNELALSPQYINYYKDRACSLGSKSHCN